MTPDPYPRRIVCLTEETTETLYLLGEGDRVAGVSGYTVRPPEARQKPRVSAFTHARYEKIEALEPDLILGFSDLQGDIAAELIKRGYPVMVFNQRSVAEILQMIRIVGALVGRADRAAMLAAELERGLDAVRAQAAQLPRRLGSRACRAARSHPRDQVAADPATRPGGADRRADPVAQGDQRCLVGHVKRKKAQYVFTAYSTIAKPKPNR